MADHYTFVYYTNAELFTETIGKQKCDDDGDEPDDVDF